jgi:hypothetical protein
MICKSKAVGWRSPVFWFLLAVSLLPGLSAEEQLQISRSEVERLISLSLRLDVIDAKLSTELATSKKSSDGLQVTLESLSAEAETLKSELADSRRICITLVSRAETSEAESLQLREALERSEQSMQSFDRSWREYKDAAEAAAAEAGIWRAVGISAGGLGLVGWILFVISLIL